MRMHAYLTYREAVAVWIGRALDWKNRDLQTKYDVDPRRLYEVWEEEEHLGSRDDAIRICRILFPGLNANFDRHTPRYRRTNIDQLDLF